MKTPSLLSNQKSTKSLNVLFFLINISPSWKSPFSSKKIKINKAAPSSQKHTLISQATSKLTHLILSSPISSPIKCTRKRVTWNSNSISASLLKLISSNKVQLKSTILSESQIVPNRREKYKINLTQIDGLLHVFLFTFFR